MAESYQHVIDRNPQNRRLVRSLLLKDQRFRGICDDYETALEAIERWSVSHKEDAKLRAAEFEKISRELGIEIDRYLNECV